MAKIERGRLSGVYGMRKHTAEELYSYARDLEAQIADPNNRDDPKWLRRSIAQIRTLADEKVAAQEHKDARAKRRLRDA